MINITDPNIIQERERELIDAISDSLDRDALVEALKEQHRLQTISGMESRHGDIVAVGDMIAYRLDFDVRTVLSILFDRSGNYVEVPSSYVEVPPPVESSSPTEADSIEPSLPQEPTAEAERQIQEVQPGSQGEESGEYLTLDQILTTRSEMITDSQPTPVREPAPQPQPDDRMTQMASDLADMISDINAKKT